MASLLRVGSRCRIGLMVKNSSLLSGRSSACVASAVNVDTPTRNASTSKEDKAANKKAVAQALDKKMRDRWNIISHDEGMKDFTRHETLPVAAHTAAAWDKEDNKNARFVDAGKLTVNM